MHAHCCVQSLSKIREDHHDPLSIASSSTERSLPVRDFTGSFGRVHSQLVSHSVVSWTTFREL
jgi:hypothetical protein